MWVWWVGSGGRFEVELGGCLDGSFKSSLIKKIKILVIIITKIITIIIKT